MAQSKSSKKLFTMAYGLGASIVIIGALFKLTHWEFGILNGTVLLSVGLIAEAIIFAISAFEPVDEDLDWTLVYPELATGTSIGAARKNQALEIKEAEGQLSKKLDDMLKEAKIDSSLMSSLGDSIRNFEGAAKGIAPTAEALTSTKKYSEELSLAAAQMESLNSLYKVQLESANRQASIQEEVASNAGRLKDEMRSLTSNLSSLNSVYGGMLTAMNKTAN